MFVSTHASRQTILLVDDAPEHLTTLRTLLQDAYHVHVAHSGLHALEIVHTRQQLDLILLNVALSALDGHTILRHLRSDPHAHDIPVIGVVPADGHSDENVALDMGMVDYITKPFRPSLALARVRTHLELRQARHLLKHQHSYLKVELERWMREHQLIQDASVQVLATLAEARDPDARSHLHRTQAYVRLLAHALKDHPRFTAALDDHAIELLVKSAPLHDIGKIGIPDSILLKPDRLNPLEWEVMKTHCRIGSDALNEAMERACHHRHAPYQPAPESWEMEREQVCDSQHQAVLDFFTTAKMIALSHHERWDGLGYPHGLAGEAIPVGARLMAVADVFDALHSHRVYKPALPMKDVIEMMSEERGHHFDPDVVDAFLKLRGEFRAIAERSPDVREREVG